MNHNAPGPRLAAAPHASIVHARAQPSWEDPANIKGGKWCVMLSLRKHDADAIVSTWLHTMLSLIGSTFVGGEHVTGVPPSLARVRRAASSRWIAIGSDHPPHNLPSQTQHLERR